MQVEEPYPTERQPATTMAERAVGPADVLGERTIKKQRLHFFVPATAGKGSEGLGFAVARPTVVDNIAASVDGSDEGGGSERRAVQLLGKRTANRACTRGGQQSRTVTHDDSEVRREAAISIQRSYLFWCMRQFRAQDTSGPGDTQTEVNAARVRLIARALLVRITPPSRSRRSFISSPLWTP